MYELARKFNLDVSLFERLVNNGLGARCLSIQHRMRQEIACLTKHFYTTANRRHNLGLLDGGIRDHDKVLKYEPIHGISSSLYLLDHRFPENSDEDNHSHSNIKEAKLLATLCKYLTYQGIVY